MAKFPFYEQLDAMDCGPTCLRMVAKFHGRHYSLQSLRERSHIDREGVSMQGIVRAAESIGLNTYSFKIPFETDDPEAIDLKRLPLPLIAHWNQNHFVVVYKITKSGIWIADPAVGKQKLSFSTFKKHWASDGDQGVVMVLEPSESFFEQEGEQRKRVGFSFLWPYLRRFRRFNTLLIVMLVLASLLQLVLPFLTKSIVDTGINNQDIDFIWLILIAQLALFAGYLSVNIVQRWTLLHMGTRINVSLISDFLRKLMRLPIGFFDSKMEGDLLQRIGDHRRVESFLTGSTLNVLFSIFNIIVFSVVLGLFNWLIFGVFWFAAILYVLWLAYFLRYRRKIDTLRFKESSNDKAMLIELIRGMQEIKLQQSEYRKRQQWMNIQARLFRAQVKSLRITQLQDVGAEIISQVKDIFITVLAAQAVIQGTLTLGEMLAIQFVIGQLNAPLQRLSSFLRTTQDAKISLERMGEIYEMEEEEKDTGAELELLPEMADIHIENLSFRYNELSPYALKNINLTIPKGKVTAIVGTSGSGKTTLVKLLLGFYQPNEGHIKLGGMHLPHIRKSVWRKLCGAVMQDGFIFSESIAQNIAESSETIDRVRLQQAVKMANLDEFVSSLPLGYNTKLGSTGNKTSRGQEQRILIARAVYKNPSFLFFDEATNSLDANNEKIIVENMQQFYEGKTVIVVAHRLSTVKNADKIVVLEKGKLVEEGTHEELVAAKSYYFNLVKNQLELGD